MGRGREVEIPILSKAPFANYDLVVYLGGGLFALLIVWRYIGRPFDVFRFSSILRPATENWTQDLLYLVLIAVVAYIIGHLISYQSSFFIERFVEKSVGRFSELLEITTAAPEIKTKKLRDKIRENVSSGLLKKLNIPRTRVLIKLPNLIACLHLPILPWYLVVYQFGLFDFADTRLPARLLEGAKSQMTSRFSEFNFEKGRQWFRWIEYYTNYNRPVAAASMYNYLIISGLMRSLSYTILISIWFELIYLFCFLVYGKSFISHGSNGFLGWAFYLVAAYVAYITTLTSYCKFFRRYVEEAIMGFVLEEYKAVS